MPRPPVETHLSCRPHSGYRRPSCSTPVDNHVDRLLTTGDDVETTEDLAEIWATAIGSLADGSLTPQQRAFVALTRPLGLVEDTALIAAPNEFTKDVLETRLRPMVVEALSSTLGREIRLAVTVDPRSDAAPDLPTARESSGPTTRRWRRSARSRSMSVDSSTSPAAGAGTGAGVASAVAGFAVTGWTAS